MIVDERSPLDLFIKELDSQPFPYYLSSIIFKERTVVAPEFPRASNRQ
jgi:hypothetical protein